MGGPTGFPELNEVLGELVAGARDVLGDNFVGAYLQGSFAVGGADEHSDVDFVVVIERELGVEEQDALRSLQGRLFRRPSDWARHLEGSYVPRHQLARIDPERRPWFYFDNGATEPEWDNHDNTAVVRWSLREHGVVLAGPDPATLVEQVTPADLRADVLSALREWEEWLPTLESWSARLQPLVVLSYCRILHTLEAGVVVSKQEAGLWALDALAPEWRDLIELALADRPDPWEKVRRPASPELVERTWAFSRYATELARLQR
jgi:predicted nucleotidyltransferase